MIPRIVHQTWKTRDVPERMRFFARSWRTHHPGWEYRLWSDADNRAFLARHYPDFLPYYDGYATPICRADAIRCFLLKHYGGVYADLDFECLEAFDPLLDTDAVVFGEEPEDHVREHRNEHPDLTRIVCNALMASPPQHPFWDHVIECMIAACREPGPLNATGPFLLTRAVNSYRGEAPVTVLPAVALYPLNKIEERTGLGFDPEQWLALTRGAHAVHHWAGTWWRNRPDDTPLPSEHARARVLERGRTVADVRLYLRQSFALTERAEPVSCLMITRERAATARLAVDAFLRQSWPARELVIIDDGDDDALREHVAALADPRIRIFRPQEPRATLGELRNRAVALARGQYVCQWDDDDLYDPDRIACQMTALRALQADACFLDRWTIWWPQQQRLAVSAPRTWEGSMLCLKSKLPPYPALKRGEDSPVADHLLQNGRVALLDQPRLYLYVVHGANTFGAEHFERHWETATLRAEGGDYARLRQEMSKRLALDDYPTGPAAAPPQTLAAAPEPSLEPPPEPPHRSRLPAPARRRRAASDAPHVLILTPVKNVADFLERYFELAGRIDHPRDKLSLAFLEGDSDDDTPALLRELAAGHADAFARIEILRRSFGFRIEGDRRATDMQYRRRGILAKCRNALFRAAHRDEDKVLWIDADLVDYPPDVLARLLEADRRIIVPHCVKQPGGPTFDLNTFRFASGGERTAWSYMIDGILLPERGTRRHYLQDLRGTPLVEVDGVGGTMLLVDAAIHAAGILFPDYSYRGFIETEGFAAMARDRGIRAWGMPDLEIMHADR